MYHINKRESFFVWIIIRQTRRQKLGTERILMKFGRETRYELNWVIEYDIYPTRTRTKLKAEISVSIIII